MIEDLIFIASLSLELVLLFYFMCHIINYIKHSKEAADPYTKWTFILLSVSFIVQIGRLPIIIIKIINEET